MKGDFIVGIILHAGKLKKQVISNALTRY